MWGGGKLETKIFTKIFCDKSCLLAEIVELCKILLTRKTLNCPKIRKKNFHYRKTISVQFPFAKILYVLVWRRYSTVGTVEKAKFQGSKIFLFLENKK
jgi:hypothetical protein